MVFAGLDESVSEYVAYAVGYLGPCFMFSFLSVYLHYIMHLDQYSDVKDRCKLH